MRAFMFCARLCFWVRLCAGVTMCTAVPLTAQAQGGYDPSRPDAPYGTPLRPLPDPNVAEGGRPSDYLRAAQAALAMNRARETEEALERAQTRMLDRSVALGETSNPSDNPTSVQIAQARQALAAHDRANCMQFLQQALSTATAQGL